MSAVKSPVPSSAPAKQDESLWLKLLQQNSARTVTPNSTVLVIGGNTYQRKDILRNLAQSSAAGDDDSLGELELVNSAFFEVEDAVFDTPVKVNMWGFHDKLIPHVSQIVKSAESQKLAALVLVDSSKDVDTTVNTLQHRLQQTASIISSLLRQLPTEKVKALQEEHRRYLSSVPYLRTGTKLDDVSAEDREAVWMSSDGRFDLSVESFPIPVIVAVVQTEAAVAASSSLMSPGGQTILSPTSSLPTLAINKELQGKLRLLCLDAGASLCALPLTLRGQSSDAQQVVQQLRRYVLHRLYPQQWQLTTSTSADGVNEVSWLSIVDESSSSSSSGAFFVPSGLDSSNLIDIATREKASDRVSLRQFLSSHPISSAVQVPGSSSASSVGSTVDASTSFQEIESEQDWLSNLHKFLSQVADTTPSTASLSGASGVPGSSAPAGSSMRRASSAYGSQSAIGSVAAATGDASTRLTASSSSDKLSSSGSGIAEGGGSGKSASTATEKRIPTVARKPSMIPAGAANQNAKDFFSSLMSDSAKK